MKYLLMLYNMVVSACYYLLYPALKPYLKGKNYTDAIFATGPDSHRGILLHAASVGEVNAIKPLLLKLLERMPAKSLCVSTTTITGKQQAEAISPLLSVCLSALDVKHLRYKQLNAINPGLICIVETEIWPNLLLWANERQVPVIFISARMSAKSHRYYRHLRFFFRYLEQPVRLILAQSEEDQQRFADIFSKPVEFFGSIKLSLVLPEYDAKALRKEWGYRDTDFVLCWGSSRPGEESLILSLLKELQVHIPNLKLILAPRHPDRLPEISSLLSKNDYALFSQHQPASMPRILVIDKLGVLDKAYCIADIAIIGGSFYDFGGHNPLEAAFYAKPIIIGPHHHACRESVKILAAHQAIMVSDSRTLTDDIFTLAQDEAHRATMGKRAKKVLTDNAGCVDKYLEEITKILGE